MKGRTGVIWPPVLAFSVMVMSLNARPGDVDPGTAIRAIYDRILRAVGSTTGVCRTRCTVKVATMSHGKSATQELHYDVIAGRGRVHTISDEYQSYQDAAASVLVIPERRLIVLAKPSADALGSARIEMFASIRDSILHTAHLITQKRLTGDPLGADHSATFGIGARAQQLTGVASMTVLYNETRQTLQRVSLAFVPGLTRRSMEMTYDEMDFNYNPRAFDTPVLGLIFDANGMLLPKYKGYSVRDMRTSRK